MRAQRILVLVVDSPSVRGHRCAWRTSAVLAPVSVAYLGSSCRSCIGKSRASARRQPGPGKAGRMLDIWLIEVKRRPGFVWLSRGQHPPCRSVKLGERRSARSPALDRRPSFPGVMRCAALILFAYCRFAGGAARCRRRRLATGQGPSGDALGQRCLARQGPPGISAAAVGPFAVAELERLMAVRNRRQVAARAAPSYQHEILVPFPVESALSGVMQRTKHFWYRRTFAVAGGLDAASGCCCTSAPSIGRPRSGSMASSRAAHRGGYDGFSFDITDALQPRRPAGDRRSRLRPHVQRRSAARQAGRQPGWNLLHADHRHLADGLARAGFGQSDRATGDHARP